MISSFLKPPMPIRAAGRNQVYLACAAALMLGLSGCAGTLSGAGPYMTTIEYSSDTYTLVEINADTIGPYMRAAAKPVLPSIVNPAPAQIRLMPGDVIDVMITDNAQDGSGLFASLSSGGTRLKVRIDNEGMISLPYVGQQRVADMSPLQVETMIRQKLKGVTSDAQAHVELAGDLSGSVLVAGAVKSPGRFSTLQSPLTLLDAINQAGGPVLEPHLVNVTVRTGTQVTTVNYENVLAGNNVVLKPNSEVILEKARQRFVAMGAVTDPGLHDLPLQNTSLLDALGSVGGLKESNANPEGVFVFRTVDAGKPLVMRINMRDPAAIFYARQIAVQPDDTIYVTNSTTYEWQKVITPIVHTLIMARALEAY